MSILSGLLTGALDGGSKAVGDVADQELKAQLDRRKELEANAEYDRRLKLAMDRKLQFEVAERNTKGAAIAGRLNANVDADMAQRYAEPVIGNEATLTEEQRATLDDGMKRERVRRERERMGLTRDPQNIVRAAVEAGYEDPKVLLQDDTKRQVAQARAEGVDANRAQALELALAKIEAAKGGKPPAGYRQTANGDLEAIKGGPADLKITGQFNADQAQLSGSIGGLDRLADATNRLLTHPGLDGITGLRGKLPNIPGSDAANASALLDTLKSQIGFSVLQSLRDSSKTGGALGNVSDKEGARLEANLAALDKAQSPEQFRDSLGQILQFTDQAKGRVREAFNLKHGDKQPRPGGDGPPRVNSPDELANLPSGTVFTAPDGSLRRKP